MSVNVSSRPYQFGVAQSVGQPAHACGRGMSGPPDVTAGPAPAAALDALTAGAGPSITGSSSREINARLVPSCKFHRM